MGYHQCEVQSTKEEEKLNEKRYGVESEAKVSACMSRSRPKRPNERRCVIFGCSGCARSAKMKNEDEKSEEKWTAGAMATRLTTDQKIPGSTPG
jgi:uncharacterized metal-binding protein